MISARGIVVLCSMLLVSACGGGGGGSRARPPAPQAGTLQLSAAAASVAETAGTAAFTITRTGGSDGAVSIAVATSNGSASAGQDYAALNTTVSFAAGDTSEKTVTVPITDDAAGEPDETLTVTLSAPTGGATLGATATASLTITDDDPPGVPLLGLAADIKQLRFTWSSDAAATSYRLLRNPDGASGFSSVGPDFAAGATSASLDVAVHRHNWLNALYQLEACNANGCRASTMHSALPAMVDAIGYVKASNTGAQDFFGWSLAASADGSLLAVGAPIEASNATGIDGDQRDNSALAAGAVYVFARVAGSWSQQAYLKASNAAASDGFGWSLAMSADGNTLAVGATGESSAASDADRDGQGDNPGDDTMIRAGAVYVFTRTGTSWAQRAYLKASNPAADDRFGSGLDLSADGTTLAVSAENEDSNATGTDGDGQDDNSAANAGAVYVFARSGAAWLQQAYVKASNTGANDGFGSGFSSRSPLVLSADGNTLAVGALGEDNGTTDTGSAGQGDNSANAAGATYVFTRSGTSWSQQAYLKASNPAAGDLFGVALALSADGNTLAISATDEDGNADGGPNNNSASRAGAVYVFTRSSTAWSQQAYVKASNAGVDHVFGTALQLSGDGNTLAVSAPGEASAATGVGGNLNDDSAVNAGAVYLFVRSNSQRWLQQTYIKATNSQAEDVFGFALVLSTDGDTLVVSAPAEDSSATGVGGNGAENAAPDSGAVYLY
jgi:hypothetical protein